MKACIKFGTVEMNHYFDVIIGVVFMKQHGIVLDFKRDQVIMRGRNLLGWAMAMSGMNESSLCGLFFL